MKSVIAMFSDQSDVEGVLESIYQLTHDEDEIEVLRVESAQDIDRTGASGRVAFPVPTTGGAVPIIDLNELDLSTEERRYLVEHTGEQGQILQIRAKEEYMDEIMRTIERHNGQATKRSR
jgi:hypothetical protein